MAIKIKKRPKPLTVIPTPKEQPITDLSREAANLLYDECQSALEEVAAKYGLKLKGKGGTYMCTVYKPKFEFHTTNGGDGITDEARMSWTLNAQRVGLKDTDLGRTFIDRSGDECRIVGYNSRASKRPISVERLCDGQTYRYPVSMLKTYL